MANWHDCNPWADRAVYVPLEELAEAVAGGTIMVESGRRVVDRNPQYLLRGWRAYGDRLDAYILPQPHGQHAAGIRFGPKDSDYLSLSPHSPARVADLLAEYEPQETTIPSP